MAKGQIQAATSATNSPCPGVSCDLKHAAGSWPAWFPLQQQQQTAVVPVQRRLLVVVYCVRLHMWSSEQR